jgi:hypothetical protein
MNSLPVRCTERFFTKGFSMSSDPNIAEIRRVLEQNIKKSENAEKDLDASLTAAQKEYQENSQKWKAHVRLKTVKKGLKIAAGKAIDHLTVVGSAILEAPGLYSTDCHIENLQKIPAMTSCQCRPSGSSSSSSVSDFGNDVTAEHCKLVLLPYIQTQKLRKFDHNVNGLIPGVGTLQTVSDALHAAEKTTDDSLHAIRHQRARELMAACKRGCPMAKNIGAELLGSLSSISAQTELEAHMNDSQGWRYLADKMLPKG